MSKFRQSGSSAAFPPGRVEDIKRRPFMQGITPALLLPGLVGHLRSADAAPFPETPAGTATGREDMVKPFTINVPQPVLDDLQARLARTRWPDEGEDAGWDYGANREYLQGLADRWQHGYDWRAEEAKLSRLAQFTAAVDGMDLHFVHIQGNGPSPTPLLLLHGWPDSFYRFTKIIPMLTDPVSYGGRAEDAFTVVVPDSPGFGFSDRPTKPGCGPIVVAGLFARLMRDVLGYDRYVAHAGDYGATILEQMALLHPEELAAIHLTSLPPQHAAKLDPAVLTDVESGYLRSASAWD